MCKVMIMPGIKRDTRKKAIEFIKEIAKEMSPGNKDGCGYAAIDGAGNLFGERWLENSQAFTDVSEVLPFGDAIEGAGEYNSFGTVNMEDVTAITLHTRLATSSKGMKNTHPFHYEQDDTSLIHNGVIDNDKDFKLQVSTCDSEAILQAYLLNEVNHNPAMIGEMAKMLYGYYACGILSRDADGNRILDVFKGNHASLVVAYLYDLNTYVFTTSESDLSSACRKLGIAMGKAYTVKEGHLLRINPFTSEVVNKEKFTVQSRYKNGYYNGTNHNGYNYDSNRGGSHSSGTTGSTSTQTTNTTSELDRTSNIIDVSNAGAKERSNKSKANEEILDMMKLTPNIREYTNQEVRELGMASGWWGRE